MAWLANILFQASDCDPPMGLSLPRKSSGSLATIVVGFSSVVGRLLVMATSLPSTALKHVRADGKQSDTCSAPALKYVSIGGNQIRTTDRIRDAFPAVVYRAVTVGRLRSASLCHSPSFRGRAPDPLSPAPAQATFFIALTPAAAFTLAVAMMPLSAMADAFVFSTGNPDGLISTATRPESPGKFEIET